MIYLIILIIIVLVIYLLAVRFLHDLSVPTKNLAEFINSSKEKTKLLIIYPHPDDELMSGGLISSAVKNKKFEVFMVSTTKGEHGDEILKLPPQELGEVRSREYAQVAKTLGVKNFELWNFTDGGMPDQENELRKKINQFVKDNEIDIIVTYEKFGMYGHPDHISLAKVVNQISKELEIRAFYSTFPDKILKRINLPKTLTYKDRVIELTLDKISDPEFKLGVIQSSPKIFLAGKHYKSQSRPKFFEQAIYSLFGNYEYYTTKYEESNAQTDLI